jgi:hypothetical protein
MLRDPGSTKVQFYESRPGNHSSLPETRCRKHLDPPRPLKEACRWKTFIGTSGTPASPQRKGVSHRLGMPPEQIRPNEPSHEYSIRPAQSNTPYRSFWTDPGFASPTAHIHPEPASFLPFIGVQQQREIAIEHVYQPVTAPVAAVSHRHDTREIDDFAQLQTRNIS